ncbi:Flp family type IVb pilin [Inquilinus sp. NPDC058860]|uniref:Flp family type IVb pilin n=1 Tax=Inquilinus sp. NPDC058860 TaxID=3346652 RepID=UPI0036AF1DCD
MLRKLINYSRRAAREEDGITAVEYAILAALIAAALVAVVPTLRSALQTGFTNIQTKITNAG